MSIATHVSRSLHHNPAAGSDIAKHAPPVGRTVTLTLLPSFNLLTSQAIFSDGPSLCTPAHDAPTSGTRDVLGGFDLRAIDAGTFGRAATARVERRGSVDALEERALGGRVDGTGRQLERANAALLLGEGTAVFGLGGREIAFAVIA